MPEITSEQRVILARDAEYARLCQFTYTADATWFGAGAFSNVHAVEGIVSGRRTVCFRGSKTKRDWLLDLLAIPAVELPHSPDAVMGLIHSGFWLAANAMRDQMCETINDQPYALCGHSLGGALALVTAGLLVANGERSPDEIVTFGAPRPGMMMLQVLLHAVPVRQYRFGGDVVPMVPTHPYCHVREPLLQIGTAIRSLDLFANHHMENYIAALDAACGPEH